MSTSRAGVDSGVASGANGARLPFRRRIVVARLVRRADRAALGVVYSEMMRDTSDELAASMDPPYFSLNSLNGSYSAAKGGDRG